MRVNYPGLLIEKHRNGKLRYRVRVEGNKARRIAIPVGPGDVDFVHHYHAGRAGETWVGTDVRPVLVVKSIDWLVHSYLDHLQRLVAARLASPLTLKQRRSMLLRFTDHVDDVQGRYGELTLDLPNAAFVRIRDAWIATPGAADNLMKACSAMYEWAVDRGDLAANPVKGIGKISVNRGGATPWTSGDLIRFKAAHPRGTTAHLWLTLQMFTACRIGDAITLGRDHEVQRAGETWLEWQPGKKGSAPVSLPMLPPLYTATRAAKIVGPTYLLTSYGKAFSSPESLRNRISKWCATAGIEGKSSHGVRKAVAELLAEAGCTQHQIMAIMAHTQAKTSEIYTKGAERRAMSGHAMQVLAGLDW
ncbi:site-specific integrase [Pseudogemmobacter faecipullorum]|uniref:Tyrosine-type recombinase/integrase n=1 Tax=Pseudogemmobacter faecipullorum TaxID=2755041 RepID=A0ABS8CM62_9RHOB|nr:tyrosine-type recombinase/integrase [Pseudogemmobacter faecipullorum]MCB5410466.1 tyrosine-type recombinase/integrase [Pseudogemmobacter faecipullorum]